MKRSLICTILGMAAVAVTVLIGSGAAVAQKPQGGETYDEVLERRGDGLKENMVIRGVHNEKTDFRKHRRFYTELIPLDQHPPYKPERQLSGTLRVSGLYLYAGTIADQWKTEFARFHPNVNLVFTPDGTVASGAVDIETGPRMSDRLRQASEYELATGERIFDIDWATGSYDVPGWSPGFVIFVNKDNPIAHLTVEQLDGIFAGARTGGWNGTRWQTRAARGREKNIRTWGELGLTGEWADKPIHVYGRPLKYNIQLGFERRVFHGGDVWNENTLEYSHEMNPDGTRYSSSVEMVKGVGEDKYGIVFSDMGSLIPQVRAVPIGRTAAGPFVPISLASLRDRSYPLFIEEWAEVRLAPGKPLNPLVKEFLTFMLSREGQDAIQRDGKWITIPASRSVEQIAKLDQKGEIVNPKELGLQLKMLAPAPWDGESPDETGKVVSRKAYYTKRWDLSDIPAYKPTVSVSGEIRLPASGSIMQSTIGKAWMDAFKGYHPGVTFKLGDGTLIDKQVDLAIGRKMTSFFGAEFLSYQLKYHHSPREIQIATGSLDVSGWSPAFAIYVNNKNPLKGLTIDQLDGIFGGPRRGGWVSTAWRRDVGRGADKNIRSWGRAGLTGTWANKPINVYIPPLKYHIMTVFERKVLQGGNMWNDSAREYPLRLLPDGTKSVPSAERVKLVAQDRDGITFSYPGFAAPGSRLLPIAKTVGGPYVLPTLDTVRDRSYPLFVELFAYADQEPGKQMDPKLKEFLSFILSREGQDIIQRDGKWLPLTGDLARAERAKLDAIVPPLKLETKAKH